MRARGATVGSHVNAILGSRQGGGGGGGGGGSTTVTATKITRTVFSVDMNFIDSDDFELPLGMPAWPAGAIEARINMGGVDASSAGTGQWAWVTKTQFDEWTAALAGASPTDATGTFYRDFSANAPSTVTSTARDFFIGKNAADQLMFASSTTSEDAYPLTVIWFQEEDVQSSSRPRGRHRGCQLLQRSTSLAPRWKLRTKAESLPSPGAGGGDSSSGYIAPKDEYVADDLGKRVWENGVEKVIQLVTQEGHSRVVVFQDLANAVSALDADGNNVTTGGAGDFLGFFQNLSGIPALSIVDGSWVALIGSGDFEIQDPTAFYSSEHWNSYNPFRGSGTRPWATITLADGTTMLDHVPFTDPDTGIVSDYRVVNTSGHAENFTTAVGEAFFVSNERKIRMVIEYTEHAADEIRYKAVPYYPPGVLKPAAVFYGVGQTEEWPSGHLNTQTGSLLRRMAFAASGPHDGWDTGLDGPYDDIFVAAADVDANIDAGSPAAATDNVVFTLPVGRYTIEVWFTIANTGGDQEAGLALARITSGADDHALAFGIGFAADEETAGVETTYAGMYLKRTLSVDGDEQLYIGAVGLGAFPTRHYMQITKVE